MAADENLLDFPIIYAIGKEGKTFKKMPTEFTENGDMTPLFETILEYIPKANSDDDVPFQMLVSSFEKNEYLGKLAVGRVHNGTIKKGMYVSLLDPDQKSLGNFKIEKMYVNEGINKVPEKEKDKAKKFKKYEPGYLHIDLSLIHI